MSNAAGGTPTLGEKFVDAIYRAKEANHKSWMSKGLSPSIIGDKCLRKLWYSFHQFPSDDPDGRVLRIFDRGNQIETSIINELKQTPGVKVISEEGYGKQIVVMALEGHSRGKLDGVGHAPNFLGEEWFVIEIKSMKEQGPMGFTNLVKNGIEQTQPKYYAQTLWYMHQTHNENWSISPPCTKGILVVENKNTQELHIEIIDYDPVKAAGLESNAKKVIGANEPPEGISYDPKWFECRFCDYKDPCHNKDAQLGSPQTCRHCKHAKPVVKGKWGCFNPEAPHFRQEALAVCDRFENHPGHNFEKEKPNDQMDGKPSTLEGSGGSLVGRAEGVLPSGDQKTINPENPNEILSASIQPNGRANNGSVDQACEPANWSPSAQGTGPLDD